MKEKHKQSISSEDLVPEHVRQLNGEDILILNIVPFVKFGSTHYGTFRCESL